MWLTIRLAWRNLKRNRRRSILTLLAVLFPVMLLDLMWGMSGAMRRNIFENTTLLETGHIQIHEVGYKDLGNTLPLINDVRPILDAVAKDSAVGWFTVRLELPALAAHENRSRGIMVQGIEPDKAQEISLIDEWVRAGRALRPDDQKTAIAGESLLQRLGVGVDDTVILITTHPESGTGVLVPTVVGQIEPPSRELSRFIVQVPLGDARTLVKNPNAATSVVVLLDGVTGTEDQAIIDAAKERLQTTLGEDYIVESWADLSPETVSLFNIIGPLYVGFSMVFFILGGLVVLNTLYLSVLERTRELGVVLALGSSRRRVLNWIEIESVLLAGAGSLIGSVLGILIVWWGSFGFTLPSMYDDMIATLGLNPNLYMRMSASEALLSAVIMFVIALAAAAYPGWRASRLEPVEAMRFVE